MNFLMLRGQIPKDRNPLEIVFDTLNECDDLWTHLFNDLLRDVDFGELWYWGGEYKKQYTSNFIERWVPSFSGVLPDFTPDLIFCRGGFEQYHYVLKKYPEAIKIYYGAGKRYLPLDSFTNYNMILQDCQEQLEECQKKFPFVLSTLYIKPAVDNIFKPEKVAKEYDVCFPANGAQKFKGHQFVYKTVPKDISILNLGNNPYKYNYPCNVKSYRVLRNQMANNISKCKVGIVVTDKIDSCPRVIPEMLACGIPIVILDRVRFWKEKYIISGVTGEIATLDNFWVIVRDVLKNYKCYSPREYYVNNLSIKHASLYIRYLLSKIGVKNGS